MHLTFKKNDLSFSIRMNFEFCQMQLTDEAFACKKISLTESDHAKKNELASHSESDF